MAYRSEIATIKRLTKEIDHGEATLETAKWERAKRVAALVDEGYTRTDIADDLGVSKSSVAVWVRVWEAFGHLRVRPRYVEADDEVSGRTTGQPARHEDKVRLARTLLTDEKIAREAVGSLGHGTKVSLGRSLVRDADVVDDLMRDDRTRREASKAVERVAEETVKESHAQDRQRYPTETADRDALAIISYINDADERVKAAIRVIREGFKVTAEWRSGLLDAVERVENTTSWLRTVIESRSRTTDEALDEILRGER